MAPYMAPIPAVQCKNRPALTNSGQGGAIVAASASHSSYGELLNCDVKCLRHVLINVNTKKGKVKYLFDMNFFRRRSGSSRNPAQFNMRWNFSAVNLEISHVNSQCGPYPGNPR